MSLRSNHQSRLALLSKDTHCHVLLPPLKRRTNVSETRLEPEPWLESNSCSGEQLKRPGGRRNPTRGGTEEESQMAKIRKKHFVLLMKEKLTQHVVCASMLFRKLKLSNTLNFCFCRAALHRAVLLFCSALVTVQNYNVSFC